VTGVPACGGKSPGILGIAMRVYDLVVQSGGELKAYVIIINQNNDERTPRVIVRSNGGSKA
jgi:hypothetical protein